MASGRVDATHLRPRTHRGSRLARRIGLSLIGSLALLILAGEGTASANVASLGTTATPSVVVNGNGTVTVSLSGTWVWDVRAPGAPSSIDSITADAAHPCGLNSLHYAVGWSVAWFDPTDKAATLTASKSGQTYTLDVGATGSANPNDADVLINSSAPCGTFEGNEITGPWSDTHVYSSVQDVPSHVCAIIYDVHTPPPNSTQYGLISNTDNSFLLAVADGQGAGFDTGPNCISLPVLAKPAVAVTPAPAPVTAAAASPQLAFTGTGDGLRGLALAGTTFVAFGGLLLATDPLRRLVAWLTGRR